MGLFSSGSAKRAAQVQAAKMAEAGQLLKDEYATLSQKYTPYEQAGTQSLDAYMRLAAGLEAPTAELTGIAKTMDPIVAKITSGDYNAYQDTPGYQFRMEQGQKALQNSAAAKGTLFSGATGKALTEYGQNYATQEYDNYLNRLYNQLNAVNTQIGGRTTGLNTMYQNLNAYSPIISTGYNAASSNAALGMDTAAKRAQLIADQGNAYASGMTAKSNQLLGIGSSLLNFASGIATGGQVQPFDLSGGTTSMPTSGTSSAYGGSSGISGLFSNASQRSGSSYALPSNVWKNPDTNQMVWIQ